MAKGIRTQKVQSKVESTNALIVEIDAKLVANAEERKALLNERKELEKALAQQVKVEREEALGAVIGALPDDTATALIDRLKGLSVEEIKAFVKA